jgi:hypothetical protein
MLLPRVRVRVWTRPRWDEDEECGCAPSFWAHPLTVALAVVAAQVVGEIAVNRWTEGEEDESPPPKSPRKRPPPKRPRKRTSR